MNSEKTDGVVLRIVEFSESSCIVTWFTRDFGKVTTMAKGARRRKNPYEGAIDVLSFSKIVFLHKRSDSLDLLTEAKLERRFRTAAKDLHRLYCGYHLLELLNCLTDDFDPHPALYDQLERTLVRLESEESLAPLMTCFELQLLKELGHSPEWKFCVNCGVEIERHSRVAFAPVEGGVVCRRCRVGRRQVISIARQVADELEFLSRANLSQGVELRRLGGLGETRGLMGQILQHLIGRPLRVLPLLGFLGRPEPAR